MRAIGKARLIAAAAALVLVASIAGVGVSHLLSDHTPDVSRVGASKVGSGVPPAVAGSRRIGRLPATHVMSVQIMLTHRSDLKRTETFLRHRHLKVTDLPDVGIIAATGTVQAMEDAFAVHLATWRNDASHRQFFANDRPATLPFPVSGIFGLNNAAQLGPLGRASSQCIVSCPGYDVDQVLKAYNFTLPNSDGAGQRVAVFAHSGFDLTDITRFSYEYYLPPANVIEHTWYGEIDLSQSGPGYSGKFPSLGAPLARFVDDGQSEVTIDVEAVHAFAPKAIIDVYEMSEKADAISTFLVAAAGLGENILTISSGICENDLGTNAHRYAELAALLVRRNRMSIFAASGDSGTQCFSKISNGFQQGRTWPGSDPSVTSVGGTRLDLKRDNTLDQESAWDRPAATDQDHVLRASGGGESDKFRRPVWQRGNLLPATRNRLVPDVAANADDVTSLGFFFQGDRTRVFGTSQGAPLWAAVAALYNQYAKLQGAPSLGPANDLLYTLDKRDRPLFDVTTSQNHGEDLAGKANEGWDMATGLGSPNVAVLIQDGVAAALRARPATDVLIFQPWVAGPGAAGLAMPLPGISFSGVTGSCDSGSADDPGRATAFRCHSAGGQVGNGSPCFADTGSGDPGSPLLCFSDPTSHRAVRLTQVAGAQLPLQLANVDNPAAPPWFLILANGYHCRFAGYGTNSTAFPYECGHGVAASLPDRTTPMWTVSQLPVPAPSLPGSKVDVLRVIY